MGSADNIVESTLAKMAQVEGKELAVFKKELLDGLNQGQVNPKMEGEFAKAAKAWGQSVEEAKKNTQDLLKTEIK